MQFFKLFLLSAVLMISHLNVFASPEGDAYQVEIQVKDRSPLVLKGALQEAFTEILIRASGDSELVNEEKIHNYLSKAQDYVERYEYLPDPNDGTQQKLILRVTFSPKMVRALIADSVTDEVTSESGINLHVYGVNGLNDFSEVVNYVRALPSVTSVEASTVDADDVILTVQSTTGKAALEKMILQAADHRLTPITIDKTSAESEGNQLAYRWVSLVSEVEQ